MTKIVLTGPESTGKSTLAHAIAKKYDLPLVSEYAREYLDKSNGQYEYPDLLTIAKGQKASEDKYTDSESCVCDTDLLTMQIWSEVIYDKCDPWILREIESYKNRFYLLCYPDLEWEYDPLRVNEHDLRDLFVRYEKLLIRHQFDYRIITGHDEQRLEKSCIIVDSQLSK